MSLGEEVGAITPLVRAMLALEPTSSASTSIITLYDGPCVLHVLILNFANPSERREEHQALLTDGGITGGRRGSPSFSPRTVCVFVWRGGECSF